MSSDIGILVVDDDPSIRMIMKELLTDAGYRMDVAEEPAIAIQKLAKAHYDIIFSDINMPGMTGIELLRSLRQAKNDVRVVIMTADATLDSAIEATRLGANDYLHKPFRSLDAVLSLASTLAEKVREERAKTAVMGSLVAAAEQAGVTGPGGANLAALAEKARRLLGIRIDVPAGGAPIPAPPNVVIPGVAGPPAGQQLMGDLDDFPLHEILQLLGMMRKTGVLRVTPVSPPEAVMSVVSGALYAAKYGTVINLKALFRLMTAGGGRFHFTPTPKAPSPKRIEQSTEWIIMEAMRHLDEVAALGKAVPPRDVVVRYNGVLHQPGATAGDPFDLIVADRLRTPMSIGQLLDSLPALDLEIYQAVIRLRRARALEVVPRPG